MFMSTWRTLLWQVGMVGLIVLVVGWIGGIQAALAMLYGGMVAVANTALLFWRWRQGAQNYHCDAGKHMRSFYRSMVERFFVVVILLAVGFLLMGNQALILLAGFVVGQVAWLLASLTLRERT
jgi:ATP synthase protein I